MKRALGLDHGEKRIGVAVSDELGWMAHPVETYQRRTVKEDLEYVKRLVHTYDIGTIAVGFPRHMNGQCGEAAAKVTDFIEQLEQAVGIPVIAWDERLTTVMASRILRESGRRRSQRRQVIDQMASVLILQSYLDSMGREAR